MSDDTKLNVKIRNAQKIIFEGEVDYVSSYNKVGPFDIYPGHANFISIIRKKLSLFKDNDMIKDLEFEQAVLEIKKDTVKIFTGIEIFTLPGQQQKANKTSEEQ